jgi:hypothetical protein
VRRREAHHVAAVVVDPEEVLRAPLHHGQGERVVEHARQQRRRRAITEPPGTLRLDDPQVMRDADLHRVASRFLERPVRRIVREQERPLRAPRLPRALHRRGPHAEQVGVRREHVRLVDRDP